MDSDAPVDRPGVDQEIAAWRAVRKGESALSVVDADGVFVGLIPPHRLLAVLLSEHEEDLSRLGGFLKSTAAAREASQEGVERRFVHRLPWLVVGLAGALLAADLVGWFEDELRVKVLLAFFIPGIVYLANAVGTQTETVIVRGLSVGVSMGRMVRRELPTGLVIGLALSGLAAPLVWWCWGDGRSRWPWESRYSAPARRRRWRRWRCRGSSTGWVATPPSAAARSPRSSRTSCRS